MTPVERVLERLHGARRNGSGWMALCPAHPDRDPSLSVSEADDGKVLVHCFVGCTAEAIVEAIGLQLRDLFADGGRRNGRGGVPLTVVKRIWAGRGPGAGRAGVG